MVVRHLVLSAVLATAACSSISTVRVQPETVHVGPHLRPIAVAYESPKFMLPVRLGTVNASGPQELFVYCLTRKGRVEPVNYRSVRLPSDAEIPEYVKDDFANFYRAMFEHQADQNPASVFLEYAWNMGWCDPCAADPLSADELRELGAYWSDPTAGYRAGGSPLVFITRLHTRYDAEHFPADLVFQETEDQSNFQGRFVIRHPWRGGGSCTGLSDYLIKLRERQKQQAQTLSDLTGWSLTSIQAKMPAVAEAAEVPWWKKLWSH